MFLLLISLFELKICQTFLLYKRCHFVYFDLVDLGSNWFVRTIYSFLHRQIFNFQSTMKIASYHLFKIR